jgi:hypothetical protein
MKTNQIHLPQLHRRCANIQKDAVTYSHMKKDALADAYNELSEHLGVWLSDYKGSELNDPYVGLCQMMNDWASPWPGWELSCLNGLTFAQFHLAQAYGHSEIALATLEQRPGRKGIWVSGRDDDDAACFGIYAAKSLTHAKQLLASKEDRLAQTSC